MSGGDDLTVDDVMEVACQMAQELQVFVDDAKECGSDLPGTRALIKDFDEINQRWNNWFQHMANDSDSNIAALNIPEA